MNPIDFLFALGRQSLAASVLVLLVLVTQQVFRKQLAPKWHCALWLIVVARLLPFSLSSPVSVFNVFSVWTPDALHLAKDPVGAPADPAPTIGTENQPGSTHRLDKLDLPSLFQYWKPAGAIAGGMSSPLGPFSLHHASVVAAFYIWLAGVILLVVCVVAQALALARPMSRRKTIDDPAVVRVLHECCACMGIVRIPRLVETTAVHSPALFGVLRPRLLLPLGFIKTFTPEEVRFVFLHELAHLRRQDVALNWFISASQIVHWFNPLIWFGFAQWRLDREIACDAAAITVVGESNRHAYGRTMLRLLERYTVPPPQPGFVGMLENKTHLRRRIRMIAGFAPAPNPAFAVALLMLLGLVGLTDAQVAPVPATVSPTQDGVAHPNVTVPLPVRPYVQILVDGSETMLGETEEEIAQRRLQTDDLKRSAPKWQHVAHALQTLLTGLPPETNFHVATFGENGLESMGSRDHTTGGGEISNIIQQLRSVIPRGHSNLEAAFRTLGTPEHIVLFTDTLPTTSESIPVEVDSTEAQRLRFFELAVKALPPRIPVQTILLPLYQEDSGTVGSYWKLANATRGGLTTLPRVYASLRTHLAFVIDTSGSMRDPNTGMLWPIIVRKFEETLGAHPNLVGLQILDGDGRFILGQRGRSGWLANTPETLDAIRNVLLRYDQGTVSNPVPGIYNAMRFLESKNAPDARIGIYIFGDEFNSQDTADTVLRRLDHLNPRDGTGNRRVVINSIGFPTTIRYRFSMGNTGLRFASLMRAITHEHGGTFVALPDL